MAHNHKPIATYNNNKYMKKQSNKKKHLESLSSHHENVI